MASFRFTTADALASPPEIREFHSDHITPSPRAFQSVTVAVNEQTRASATVVLAMAARSAVVMRARMLPRTLAPGNFVQASSTPRHNGFGRICSPKRPCRESTSRCRICPHADGLYVQTGGVGSRSGGARWFYRASRPRKIATPKRVLPESRAR